MLYFHTITQGILFGLALALMAGPAFFSLIQTSISHGFRKGSHLAIGISISDIIMAFIAWYGLSSLFESNHAQKILSICGGIVLLCFGIYTALKRHVTIPENADIDPKSKFHFKYSVKGFIFNIANPTTWMFWLIPIGVASSYPSTRYQIIFLASILATTLSMDLLKCAISNELKKFMTDRVITYMNRIIGIILILFGIYLICTLFFDMSAFMPEFPQQNIIK